MPLRGERHSRSAKEVRSSAQVEMAGGLQLCSRWGSERRADDSRKGKTKNAALCLQSQVDFVTYPVIRTVPTAIVKFFVLGGEKVCGEERMEVGVVVTVARSAGGL